MGRLLWLLLAIWAGLGAKIDEGPELASEQIFQEAVLEAKYFDLKERHGVADRRTLEAFFELFDLWIMLYRLNKIDEAMVEVLPACQWRQDQLTIKAIQAVAFLRWKQGRHREALARFHEMEGTLGKNPAICENIGHTYNALGMPKEAEQYFQQSLVFVEANFAGAAENKGGALLGLAGVREKQLKIPEALEAAQQAYDFYKSRDQERGWESSLTAKAAMAVSKMQLKLENLDDAEAKAQEAVRLFESTSGEDSPLLASAWKRLGEVQMKQERFVDARIAFHMSYKLEAIKDAFDLTEIVIVHQALMDAHLGRGPLDRTIFRSYFGTISQALQRVRKLKQDGNAGAFYKLAGEV
ncbi:unnamed protein product [Effrenium voratum]|uniref:Tetratricopeptide repeat protein n=1 Tax=Effrenium voratum TaxID=2562239 RepID=A0AA36IFV8_9DINO|nr:unnamed protein product [Effrenium voratum]